MVENPWVLFLSLSLFHIIGAAVMAGAVRGLWRGFHGGERGGCQAVFTMLWGAAFGFLPFMFGVGHSALQSGAPLFLVGQVAVWTGTFLTVLLARGVLAELLQPFLYEEILLMLFGGVFIVSGAGVFSLVIREGSPGALVAAGILTLVGSAVCGLGAWRLFRSLH